MRPTLIFCVVLLFSHPAFTQNAAVSQFSDIGSIGAFDTIPICQSNSCGGGTVMKRGSISELDTWLDSIFVPQANMGPSMTYSGNALNIANTTTTVTSATGCTAATSGSTCGSPNGNDDYRTFYLACSAAQGVTCFVTLGTAHPVDYLCFKNTGTVVWGIQPGSGWTLAGAPGVVNGNPAARGGTFYLIADGEACVQNTGASSWEVVGYHPGSWFQMANGVSNLTWLGLGTFYAWHLHCNGLAPATAGDNTALELYYNGTVQTSGYSWTQLINHAVSGGVSNSYPGSGGYGDTTSINLTGGETAANSGSATGWGTQLDLDITSSIGSGSGYEASTTGLVRYQSANYTGDSSIQLVGSGPQATTAIVTGIELYNQGAGSNLASGICWVRPNL